MMQGLLSCVGSIEIEDERVNDRAHIESSLRNTDETIEMIGIEIPPNSNVNYVGDELMIELPIGNEYVGTASSGAIIRIGVLGVRCKCTDGSGCTANKTTDKNEKVEFTCIIQKDCKTCEKPETSFSGGHEEIVKIVGLVNYNLGIGFLTDMNVTDQNSTIIDVSQYFTNQDLVKRHDFEELFEL